MFGCGECVMQIFFKYNLYVQSNGCILMSQSFQFKRRNDNLTIL